MSGKDEAGGKYVWDDPSSWGIWGVNTGKAKQEVARGSTFYPYLIRPSVKESVVQ